MDSKFIMIGLAVILSGCASQASKSSLSLEEEPSLEWPQDYKNADAPEDYIPPLKPAVLKDCITDSVILIRVCAILRILRLMRL